MFSNTKDQEFHGFALNLNNLTKASFSEAIRALGERTCGLQDIVRSDNPAAGFENPVFVLGMCVALSAMCEHKSVPDVMSDRRSNIVMTSLLSRAAEGLGLAKTYRI